MTRSGRLDQIVHAVMLQSGFLAPHRVREIAAHLGVIDDREQAEWVAHCRRGLARELAEFDTAHVRDAIARVFAEQIGAR